MVGYHICVSEAQKIEKVVPPAAPDAAPPHAGTHLMRMLLGSLWILLVFAAIAGICYLEWPWIMAKVAHFYD
jgi:hypothetical protein